MNELRSLGIVDSRWVVSWVALRDRNYLFEFRRPGRRLMVKCLRKQTSGRATAARFLSNELRVLRFLETLRRDSRIPKLAPLPLAEFPSRGIWIQECLPGYPLRSNDVLNQSACQSLVLGQLRCLGKVGQGVPLTFRDLMRELPKGVSSGLRYQTAREAADELAGKLQPCLGHNDLNPSNILIDGQSVTFADWTFSRERGRPCFDWFDLVSHAYLDSHHLSWCDLAKKVGDPSEQLITDYLRGARQLLGSPEIARDLLQLYLATRFANLVKRYHPETGDLAVHSMLASLPWLKRSGGWSFPTPETVG